MLEDGPCLPAEDPELVAVMLRRLRKEGVRISEHARANRFERKSTGGFTAIVASEAGEEQLEGSHLLVMTAPAPDTESLDLKKGGIATQRGSGAVRVSAMLRTSNSRVYAIGDVAGLQGGPGLAEHQAGLVLRGMLFRLPAKQRALVVPRVVLADPELVQVGLTEAEARKQAGAIRILRQPYAGNDRAQAEGLGEGHIKLLIDRRDRILGVGIAGANAADLIAPWTLALSKGLSLRDMAEHIAPTPTMGEIGKRAAISYLASAVATRTVRRLASLLRLFG
jgi:pyruvate/2-oxoglutarate dehydrogenase complex dihydrolipoamide dehydrogenase (E3) component